MQKQFIPTVISYLSLEYIPLLFTRTLTITTKCWTLNLILKPNSDLEIKHLPLNTLEIVRTS